MMVGSLEDRAVAQVRAVLADARAIVCDFDGTLVDSNPIKWRAFERCFTDLPAPLRESAWTYCRRHHHTPRGEKFRHVYEQILQQPYTAEIAQRLERQFEEHTTAAIIRAPEIPGAGAFLASMGRSCLVAVLSSTPHELLRQIIEARGWATHVGLMRGAPVRKADWLRQLCATQGYPGHAVVVFGDMAEDAVAAHEAGCRFVGIGTGPFATALAVLSNFLGLLGACGTA